MGENEKKRIGIFLDRDATIIEDRGYTYKIEDFKLLPNVIEGLKKLKDFDLFIILNQSGIGRGYYTEEDMNEFNKHLLNEFEKQDIKIKKIYFCPHTPNDDCNCRKPKIELLKQAEEDFDLTLNECYVIGNRESDILCAQNAGGKGILVPINGEEFDIIDIIPDYKARDLEDAAEFILSNH